MHEPTPGWTYAESPPKDEVVLMRRKGSPQIPYYEWRGVPRSALLLAMQAGSWFDRKDLSLAEREQMVAQMIACYASNVWPQS